MKSVRTPYVILIIACVLASIVRIFPSDAWAIGLTKNYLALHVLLEFTVIIVSFGIASVGLATFHNTRDINILVFSVTSLVIGAFDLGHTLTFAGMPDFFGPSSNDKTIAFWLMSRSLGALAYAYIAFSSSRKLLKLPRRLIMKLLAISLLVIACGYDFVLFHRLPEFFVPGKGLTIIKIEVEWACIIFSALSSIMLFRKAEQDSNFNIRWTACACAIYALCGYFFTIYHDMDDLYVFTGHVFKACSALILYRAVFFECVEKPFIRVEALAAEASAASLAKSRFLANVSHEFRTPLGVIGGFGDLLLASPYLDIKLREWTTIISRNARQLGLLIDDLLDLTKAEQEKIELHLVPFNLANLLREMMSAFEIQAGKKGLKLKLEADAAIDFQVTNDENRVRQVVLNLLSNALKFTREGEITMRVEHRMDHQICISVRDTGGGISEIEKSSLFQPFSQLGDPSRRTFGGTGLGLAVSRNLAELMGGSLTLYSSDIGRGSEFHFLLRSMNDDGSSAKAVRKEDFDQLTFVDRRVLIAEDSPDNRSLLKFYLEPTGVRVDFAVNGREAVSLVEQNSYDLILMDLQMPEMDGFEATQKLRASKWTGTIVALTAHALQPERERALKNGFDGYLIKPITRNDLWREMRDRFAQQVAVSSLH